MSRWVNVWVDKNVPHSYCGYSLEVSWRGSSNEYPQHVFMENKRNIYVICPDLELGKYC